MHLFASSARIKQEYFRRTDIETLIKKEEKVLLEATVCFLHKENEILLAMKTRKIGEGCWNGYGGGVEKGEKVIDAAARELEEESGVSTTPQNLNKIAVVDFHNTKSDDSTFVCRVHFYLVDEWTGSAKETEEMVNPTWFEINNLPLDQMMPADKVWLPIALSGKKIMAKACLGPFQKKLLRDVEIKYIDSFPVE